MLDVAGLDFEKGGGLVTVVTQDARSGAVLMVAHADREALEKTLATGEMHYRSRSRGPWHKGETSGNTQAVVSLAAVLARVIPSGPACHTEAPSCFGEEAMAADALGELDRTLAARAAGPEETMTSASRPSYTRRLLADRNLRLKKIGEESAEFLTACADGDAGRAADEGVDLIYHALVALRSLGVTLEDLRAIVARRAAAG